MNSENIRSVSGQCMMNGRHLGLKRLSMLCERISYNAIHLDWSNVKMSWIDEHASL